MTGRFLRVELRRSAAGGIALLMLVVGTVMPLSSTQSFTGRWMQLAVNTRSMLMVLLPLALAGGAWPGRRETRHRVDELFAQPHRVVRALRQQHGLVGQGRGGRGLRRNGSLAGGQGTDGEVTGRSPT
ncbi:hypothetical protein AB0J90_09380 [Micromonospora sp. NPDC049523]|uniref:hypothetical protein n=1 Tax=Micromonospora sp. NPDC049523 TaxID=3155921 RepID=UPI00343AF11F